MLMCDLYKNRELRWNVKDKDTESWEMDTVYTLIDVESWIGKP